MLNHKPGCLTFAVVLLLSLAIKPTFAQGQEEEDHFRVERVKVVNQRLPIHNIYVDEDNVKWIANANTIFKVESKDVATPIPIPEDQQSLLQLPGGNFDIRWSKREIRAILGEGKITTAAYNKRDKILWIGTDGWGVYKLKVDGGLRLIEEIFIDNSKLRSDFINLIYISPQGKVWIATEDGAMLIENGSASMYQKFFDVQTISGDRNDTWATGDGIVWIIDKKNNWSPIEINDREIEGTMHDIAFDADGRIWIASNIMTSYKIKSQRYEHFGPGQYFTSQFVNYVSVDADGTIWVGTDDKGVYIIEKSSTITVTTNLDKPLSCDGTVADAQISVRAVGGTPPYAFTWSDGVTGEKRTNVAAGIYNLTVTDIDGATKDAVIKIGDPTVFLTLKQEQQVSEEGASDGIAVLLAEGGTPGYRAFWNTGKTGTRIENLAAGNYFVTVTDQAGCSAVGEVEITTKIGEMSVALEQSRSISCFGGSDAAIVANLSGGKAPFTYVWENITGNITEVSGLVSGSYSLTITDVMGTTTVSTIEIKDPVEFTVSVSVLKQALTDNADGQAQVTLAGGKEPFSYTWSNGESSNTAITLAPAEHTVTVTDADGCTAVGSFSISENILPLTVSIAQQDDILCAGEHTGGLIAQIEGGKGPMSFIWSNGESTAALVNIGAGVYTVTVTDAVGSSSVFETELTEPTSLVVNSMIDAVASTDNADGGVTLNVNGGVGDYSYVWQNGETGVSATTLGVGDYSVSVTDANGCMVVTTVTMSENILPLQISILQQQDILCGGELTGELTLDISGGKGPFSYAWSNGVLGLDNLAIGAGIYSVTVTDGTGSTAVFQTEITEPEAIVINTIIESPANTDKEDGRASVNVTGGSPAYTYAWSNGESSPGAELLAPGEHIITVTDVNGCSATTTLSISEDILPLSVTVSQNELIVCKGGSNASVTANVNGGKGPFIYNWSSTNIQWQSGNAPNATGLDAGVVSVTVTDALSGTSTFQLEIQEPAKLVVNLLAEAPASTDNADGKARAEVSGGMGSFRYEWDTGEMNQVATALSAGSHGITVYDEAGCSATATIDITEDILPLAAIVTLTSEILCNGGNSGGVEVQISGGKGPFTYVWSSGATSTSLDQLVAGDYVVTVIDALETQIREGLTVVEPEALDVFAKVISSATTDASDGSADVSVQGGVAPYAYVWDNGEEAALVSALAPGVHAVTVSDANGCTAETTIEITENILPLSVDVERDVSNILCYGDATGIIKATPNGGKGPFTYTWSDGSIAGADRNDLGAGEYTLTVTDITGSEATAMVPIQHPDALIANITALASANTDQSDGKAQVLASGGTGPYTYSWDSGEDQIEAGQLSAGVHIITVTDNNGCSTTAEIEISEDILPLAIQISQTSEITCAGLNSAGLEAIVSGGKRPFVYAWSDGGGADGNRDGLGAGEYTLTVTDAVGSQATAAIPILQPEVLIANASVLASANTDQSDGKAQLVVSGGSTPYTFAWDNGEVEAEVSKLGAGSHSVTVTDNNGCSVTASLEITEDILPLSVQIAQTSESKCAGLNSGAVKASSAGGKGPFSYKWSNGSTGEEVSGLAPGNLTVTITDAIGQTANGDLTVKEPDGMKGEITEVRAAGAEHVPDGKGNADVSGGAGGYKYNWDSGESGQKAANLSIGSHTVTVTDANGCSITMSVDITKKILPLLTAESLKSGKAVRMEKLQFAADSTKVNSESIPTLEELYAFLYDNPTIVVEVGGHTNGLPEHDYCDQLSKARAKSVAQWIVQRGIDEKRVYFKGYGKRKPVASNRTPDGRRKNQRVEVRILDFGD